MNSYSHKKEDLDKSNNKENKSEKYRGISKEDIDREMQLRLEGGWTTKIKNEYKCFDNEHVDYEPVKEAGVGLEKEKRWPTAEEMQAEYDRTHWKEHLKNLGSGQGNYGERYGKRGGRYYERRSKNGNIYRQYF